MTPESSASIAYAASALFLLCLSGQVLHAYLRFMHSNPRSRWLVSLYEGALFAHVGLMATFSMASLRLGSGAGIAASIDTLPLAPILWGNVAVALVVGYAALSDIDDSGDSDGIFWMLPTEVVLACLCTPLALSLLGEMGAAALMVDAAYFAFRTVFLLVRDHKARRKIVSPLSLSEALKRLPEGILYASESGRNIVANDTMSHLLASLGIPSDKARPEQLWELLNEKSSDPAMSVSAGDSLREPGSWIVLRVNPREVRLFSFEGAGFGTDKRYPAARPLAESSHLDEMARGALGTSPHSRVIAYDVTEEIEVLEQIEQANAELASSQQELIASAETAREVAENEAMLKMRGRVHDVIGQRLSLLHRALEDNAISDEELARLKPLIVSILDDLLAGTRTAPADELAATIDAFALSGIAVHLDGSLPEDEACAKLFADCIREAATNAVKHARARNVKACIRGLNLDIENDGMPPAWPIEEGTGLANMRRAVEAAGGTLEISPSPFTLHVRMCR